MDSSSRISIGYAFPEISVAPIPPETVPTPPALIGVVPTESTQKVVSEKIIPELFVDLPATPQQVRLAQVTVRGKVKNTQALLLNTDFHSVPQGNY
jgi:hypothetical protein